jgi:large subunit ribosomal protein L16
MRINFLTKKNQKGKAFNKLDNVITFKNLKFNTLKLISLSYGRITKNQINAIISVINKIIKKIGIFRIDIFPSHSVTTKSLGIRMGKGKGGISHHVFNASIGITLCSIKTFNKLSGYKALKLAQIRLPIKTKIIML